MSEYRVNLEVFSGPLDLLLYLVRKEEVDIYDIPISRITAQYIQYLEMLKQLDIDLAGDFLVMAASLMEIKSAMLLPAAPTDDEGEATMIDPRAELVRQLLEYKKFKDAANLLEESAEIRGERFTRPDKILSGLKDSSEPEIDLDQVSIWTLLEAFDGILKSVGHYQSYEHISDDTPIDLYQIEILHRLQTEGPLSMEQIFKDRGNRLVMIGLFLGILELIRLRLIWAEQPEAKGPILLRALTNEPAEQVVPKAIYAAEAESAAESHATAEIPEAPVTPILGEDEEDDLPDEELIFENEETKISPSLSDILSNGGTDKPDNSTVGIESASGTDLLPRIPIVELPAKPAGMGTSSTHAPLSQPTTTEDESPIV
ncbi:MAG: segregation/condensation protein A [Phycisphaerae bacterium]|nr:segregation/condensation protein A [Phycisphaerae bacterium]